MTQSETTQSDTGRIFFSVRSKPVHYGDGVTFYEFRIVMRAGEKVVGVDEGPSRTHAHATRRECLAAAYERARELRMRRLLIVDVSAKDIENGEARSCQSCAIAQALWRNQERISMDRRRFDFRVEPYGAFTRCNGIVLDDRDDSDSPEIATGLNNMPDLVGVGPHGLYVEGMYDWAVAWDEWADSRHMTFAEWREEHPDDGRKPYKPPPCSFVLDLSAMKPMEAQ